MGGFCPLVELHWEGFAPAACAAGLFIKGYLNLTGDPFGATIDMHCVLNEKKRIILMSSFTEMDE